MKKSIIYIIIIVAVVVVVGMFMRSDERGDQARAPGGALEPESLIIALDEWDGSGESGTATLTKTDGQGKTRVVIDFPVNDSAMHPVYIYDGRCGSVGEILYPLTDIGSDGMGSGGSETVIDVTLGALYNQLPFAINVHASQDDLGTTVACGDLAARAQTIGKSDDPRGPVKYEEASDTAVGGDDGEMIMEEDL